MSVYTKAELAYLQGERRLAHVATVGTDGTPHVTPVGMWSVDPDSGVVEVTGHQFADTKKFRDVARSGRAALVVDDVLPPWQPRGIEIRGHADAVAGPRPHIRIHPKRIIGWGLDDTGGGRNARDVPWTSGSVSGVTSREGALEELDDAHREVAGGVEVGPEVGDADPQQPR